MMKAIALLLFVGVFLSALAEDRMASGIYLIKSELDESIEKGQATYNFSLANIPFDKTIRTMKYSVIS